IFPLPIASATSARATPAQRARIMLVRMAHVPRPTVGPGTSDPPTPCAPAFPIAPDPPMSTPPRAEALSAKLERHFGFKRFRAGQVEAVSAAMSGRDVLII